MKYLSYIYLAGVFLMTLANSVAAQEEWADAFRRETRDLEIEVGAITEILRFDEKDHSLSDEYAAALVQRLRDIGFSESESQLEIFQQGIAPDRLGTFWDSVSWIL